MREQQKVSVLGGKPAINSFNILKVIVMIGLPFVHIMEICQLLNMLDSNFGILEDVITALTVFGPSVFMICLGLNIGNSSSPDRLRKTGIQMIIISLGLNLVRYTTPNLVRVCLGLAKLYKQLNGLLESDIFFFVGLFYILYSYMKKAKLSTVKISIISVVMLLVNDLLSKFVYTEITVLDSILGNFATICDVAYFPILGWCIYPCIGMLIGEKLLPLEPRRRNAGFGILFAVGAVLFGVTSAVIKARGGTIVEALAEFAVDTLYELKHVGLIVSISLMTISVVYFLYQLIKENPVEKFLLSMSPLVFPYYLMQWVGTSLVTYYVRAFCNLTGRELPVLSKGEYFIVSAVVTAICIWLTYTRGFTFSRWVFRVSDYTKWGKKKNTRSA